MERLRGRVVEVSVFHRLSPSPHCRVEAPTRLAPLVLFAMLAFLHTEPVTSTKRTHPQQHVRWILLRVLLPHVASTVRTTPHLALAQMRERLGTATAVQPATLHTPHQHYIGFTTSCNSSFVGTLGSHTTGRSTLHTASFAYASPRPPPSPSPPHACCTAHRTRPARGRRTDCVSLPHATPTSTGGTVHTANSIAQAKNDP